jgi:hypothetical protein
MAVPNTFATATGSIPLSQLDANFAACLSSTVTIAQGGTGQTTKINAFDALSPTTTKGDLIVSDGTDNVRLPVGTNGQTLVADSTVAEGVKWAAAGSGTVTSVAVSAPAMFTVSGSPITSTGTIAITYSGTALPVANGGTGSTSAPSANATLNGFTTTATAAGTTTLTNTSSVYQLFTGSTTQTITLPVVTTLAQGWLFHIVNNSTGNLTVNSSGSNLVITVLAGTAITVTCILATGTTAASWEAGFTEFSSATGTGNVVLSTSPTLVTPVLGTPTSGTLSGCTVDGTDAVGFRNVPINSQSAAYTAVLADSGKAIFHPSTDANARTFTIPANASVAYPIGTVLTFINMTTQVVSIAITTDTMYLAGTGTTGTRSLALYGMASAIKMTATTWLISGNGLT